MANPSDKASHLPRLRPKEKEGDRRTTWTELLNDLVFTVIIGQLAQRLQKDMSGPAFGQFLLLYVPVWWLWNGETHYSTRFDNERDVVHRLLVSLQLVGLIVLAASIPNALESGSRTYALTYAAVRMILLIEYGRAWYYVPEARPYIRHIVTGFGISVLLWIGSVFMPVSYRYVLWGIGLLIELTTPLTPTGGRLHRQFPPDVRHLPERYGLFTLLVLGQSVTGTTQGLIASGFDAIPLLTTVLGGIVIIGLWWAYFDRLDDDAVRQVSEGGTARLYAAWLYLHLPLTIALTLIGVGLSYVIQASAQAELTASVRWLLVGSVAAYLLTEAGISLTTLKAGPPHASFVRGMSVRGGVAVLLLVVGLFWPFNAVWLMGFTATLIVGLILSDYFAPEPPGSEERINQEADTGGVEQDAGR